MNFILSCFNWEQSSPYPPQPKIMVHSIFDSIKEFERLIDSIKSSSLFCWCDALSIHICDHQALLLCYALPTTSRHFLCVDYKCTSGWLYKLILSRLQRQEFAWADVHRPTFETQVCSDLLATESKLLQYMQLWPKVNLSLYVKITYESQSSRRNNTTHTFLFQVLTHRYFIPDYG